VQEHTYRVNGDGQLLGDLLIAPALQAMQAESLGLFRRYATEGNAKALGQLGILRGLGRCRRVVREGLPVGRLLVGGLPASPTKAIHGPSGDQAQE
jgi:hypothetical protein